MTPSRHQDSENTCTASGSCLPVARSMSAGALFCVLARHQFAEHAVLLVDQRKIFQVEFLEEFIPGNLDQGFVFRLRVLWEHDPNNAHVALGMGAVDRSGFAAFALRPFPDGVVICGGFSHGTTSFSGSNV